MLMDNANGMDFWGEEVIGGEPLAVVPKEGLVIHLSQVCLGKGNGGDQGAIYVKVGEQKTVLGYLSSEKMLQMPLDLAFGKAFELSHNMKNRSVHFSGYHTCIGDNIQEYGNINSISFATLISCCVPTFDYEDHDSEIEDDDSAIQNQEEISTLKKEFESRQNESASDTPVCAKKAKKTDGRQKNNIEDASEDDEDGSNDESDELPHSHHRLLVDSMVFWAAEVMVGEPLSVVPKKDHIIHLSQVCLGEAAGDDQGAVCVKIGEQKIVLGNLSSEKIPQMPVDLVFKNEFVLAHNMKNKSVHFSGYQIYVGDDSESENPESNSDDMYDSSERENSEFAEYFGDFHNLREIRKERNIPGKKDKSSDDHSNRFWRHGIFKGDQSARSHDSFFMDDGDEDANM